MTPPADTRRPGRRSLVDRWRDATLAGMNVVVLGGTKGIGRAVARRMAERGDHVVLLGRDDVDVARSAADLLVRGAASAGHAHCDLERPDGFAAALDQAA